MDFITFKKILKENGYSAYTDGGSLLIKKCGAGINISLELPFESIESYMDCLKRYITNSDIPSNIMSDLSSLYYCLSYNMDGQNDLDDYDDSSYDEIYEGFLDNMFCDNYGYCCGSSCRNYYKCQIN